MICAQIRNKKESYNAAQNRKYNIHLIYKSRLYLKRKKELKKKIKPNKNICIG